MNTLTALVASKTPTFHNKTRGDTAKLIKTVNKKGLATEKNAGLTRTLEYLHVDSLEPLESQRITKTEWVQKRIEKCGGLDWFAFGQLSICRDTNDGIDYIWDGCGRHAIAKAVGIDIVPCVVIEGRKEDAAKYFAYNQDEGRRSLSKEVLFVNQVYSGDKDALIQLSHLQTLGMFVQGDTDMPAPNPVPTNSIEVNYRTFNEGLKIAKGDLQVMRQARDMIAIAWSQGNNVCKFIQGDIYWGLLHLLVTFPSAQTNGVNAGLQTYLNSLGGLYEQKKIKWKPAGLSGNSGVAPMLSYGLLCDWGNSQHFKPSYANTGIRKKVLEDTLGL